ncbi:MAG: hypothetical protein IT245_02880 [Bacteroidia bacterium]|nr:hypothetical protein [Bacteroidia bacterium]
MIRRIIFFLVASSTLIYSCKPKSETKLDSWKDVYTNAYTNHDYVAAVVALNHLLVTDTANAAKYYDSLAYYSIKKLKNFDAGKRYTDKGLLMNPDNAMLLEFKGIFLGSENNMDDAKNCILKAYKISGLNKHKYMYASLKFSSDNDLDDYIKTINEILYGGAKQEYFEANVDAGTTQIVDLKSSCYLDKAKISLNSNKIKESLVYLDSALLYSPNFQEAMFYKEKITTGK